MGKLTVFIIKTPIHGRILQVYASRYGCRIMWMSHECYITDVYLASVVFVTSQGRLFFETGVNSNDNGRVYVWLQCWQILFSGLPQIDVQYPLNLDTLMVC